MRGQWAICVVFLAAVYAASGALADNRVALVIGNAAYVNTVPLASASHDVDDIAAALRRLSFQVIAGKDLDKRSLERAVRQFAVGLTGADVALFYYVGHSLQVRGLNYLVPTDAKLSSEDDVDFEIVSLGLILKQMEREAKASLVFLDASRHNPLGRNLAQAMGPRGTQVGQGLAEVRTAGGTVIGFSTQPGSLSFEGPGRNSRYAAALLEHIEVPGKDVTALLDALRTDVHKATDGRQQPWDRTSLSGAIFLRPEPRVATAQGKDLDRQADIAYWNLVRTSKSHSALQAYLDRYPSGAFAGLARTAIADLTAKPAAPAEPSVKVAGSEPVAVPKPKANLGGYDAQALGKTLRKELERVGCIAGATDATWDDEARHALSQFALHAKVVVPADEPTLAALQAVQARKERMCPLKCSKGETDKDGQCVAEARARRLSLITSEKRQPERASVRRQPVRPVVEEAPPAKPELCWNQGPRGTQSVAPCVR